MMTKKIKRNGFTLIEMAIVLMIIAILLGATIKGNAIINSAKLRQLEADFNTIPLMIYGYQSKYKAIPGDDKSAVEHFLNIEATVKNGDGEGLIAGKWFEFDASTDSTLIWQHLRLAGLMNGETNLFSSDYLPRNIMGQRIDFHSGTVDGDSPIVNLAGEKLKGNYTLCSKGIPGELAMSLDIRLDDGNPGMGSMLITPDTEDFRAGAQPATIGTNTASDISDEKSYIVCMRI